MEHSDSASCLRKNSLKSSKQTQRVVKVLLPLQLCPTHARTHPHTQNQPTHPVDDTAIFSVLQITGVRRRGNYLCQIGTFSSHGDEDVVSRLGL